MIKDIKHKEPKSSDKLEDLELSSGDGLTTLTNDLLAKVFRAHHAKYYLWEEDVAACEAVSDLTDASRECFKP